MSFDLSFDHASEVINAYHEIDDHIAQFKETTGLECPVGCGQCCENPEVYTTPLEMLPLALELVRRGDEEIWLHRSDEKSYQGSCVLYQPDPLMQGNGRCLMYQWRPSICRLFGFSARHNKVSQVELMVCKRHKQTTPDIVAEAQWAIAQDNAQAPNMVEWTQHVTSINPTLGMQRMPINKALAVAINHVGLRMQVSAHADPSDSSSEGWKQECS